MSYEVRRRASPGPAIRGREARLQVMAGRRHAAGWGAGKPPGLPGAGAAAYLMSAMGLRRVPASTVGSLALGEPLTASILGFAVLGERPGAAKLFFGGALLLVGLVLLAMPLTRHRGRALSPAVSRAAPAWLKLECGVHSRAGNSLPRP